MTTVTTITTSDHVKTAGMQVPIRQMRSHASKVGRFLLHFLEMQIPMWLGMALFGVVVRQLRASPSFSVAFQRGSDLSIITDSLFMSIPMVVWMIFRRHGWRHSLEMAAAMIAPMIAIIVLGWLGADAALPWLAKLACPAGSVGMLGYMLYHHDHFTGQAAHSAHADNLQGEKACH